MNFKKTLVGVAVASALGLSATGVQAATLSIDSGSYFTMGGGLTVNAPGSDGQFITGNNGIITGTTQFAYSGPGGAGNLGPQVTDIDNAWSFFFQNGVHLTTSPVNVLGVSGDAATLDFSGWAVSWNGLANIPMGTGAWNGNAEGVAQVSCASGSGCVDGSAYTLMYSATVPDGDPSNFGGTKYLLSLTGSISGDLASPVPAPAAVWLFGAGLAGLMGVVRRSRKEVASA